MTIEIYAATTPDTLAVECSEIFTMEDARYLLERCFSAVQVDSLHFLIDCSNLHTLAPGVLAMFANASDFLQHPNTRWLAFVTQNSLLERSLRLLLGDAALEIFSDRDSADNFLRGL
jgi:hypothetical protein